jgi:hypothetical protein
MHEFWYDVVELCKVDTEQLFQRGLKGLLPLVPLTREGKKHQSIERVIRRAVGARGAELREFIVADIRSSRLSA